MRLNVLRVFMFTAFLSFSRHFRRAFFKGMSGSGGSVNGIRLLGRIRCLPIRAARAVRVFQPVPVRCRFGTQGIVCAG
jgi:hypothetical protein